MVVLRLIHLPSLYSCGGARKPRPRRRRPLPGGSARVRSGSSGGAVRVGLGRRQLPGCASLRCQRVDAPGGRSCTSIAAIVLGALCLAPGAGLARPGDPFGPDDTGCAPDTRNALHCESALARALSTLVAQMTRCKLRQADNAFRILHPRSGSTPPPRFDEARCVQSQAKAPFDQALSQLEGAGLCPAAALVNAHALGNSLVAGQST